MILPIVMYGQTNNILKVPTKPSDVENNKEGLLKLILDMGETLKSVGGLGLAANQVGKDESVCIVNLDNTLVAMVNPQIVEYSGEQKESIEGCLSLPDVTTRVTRHEVIKVKFINPNKDWSEETLEVSFPNSVIVQHEVDHLNGKLMIDNLSPFERNLISTKLKRIARGNIGINYVGMIWRESQKSWSIIGPYMKLVEFYNQTVQQPVEQSEENVVETPVESEN